MRISSYSPVRAHEIADLFHQAVHAIDETVYSAIQKEAWAPTPPDYKRWVARLADKKPFMALIDNRVVGFMELVADGYIDCAYTHPDFQGQGVGSALYEHLLLAAKSRALPHLYVDASFIARPFFAHRGFTVVRENIVVRHGVALTHFRMQLNLPRIKPTGNPSGIPG